MGSESHSDVSGGMPGWLIIALFAGVSLVLALPVFMFDVLPFADAPNHMARHYIVGNAGDPALAKYWQVNAHLLPNSAVDVLLLPFGDRLDPYLATRIVFAFTLINFLASMMVLHRVVWGSWSAWPLLGAVFAYNGLAYWGLENFYFMVAFALYGVALWVALSKRALWLRVVVFFPYALLMYFGHVFVFAMFAIAVGGFELHMAVVAGRRAFARTVLNWLILSAVFVGPAVHFVLQTSAQGTVHGSSTKFGALLQRFDALVWLTGGGLGYPGASLSVFFAFALLVVVYLFIRNRVVIARRMWGPILAIFVTALVVPFQLFGVWLVNTRIPIFLMGLLVPALHLDNQKRQLRVGLALAAAAVIVIEVGSFVRLASLHQQDFQHLRQVTRDLPIGSRVLPVDAGKLSVARRWNMPSYLIIDRHSFVPTLFQGVHMVSLREKWQHSAHPQLPTIFLAWLSDPQALAVEPRLLNQHGEIYWTDWQQKFTHVLMFEAPFKLDATLGLTAVARSGPFALFTTPSGDQR